MHCLCKSYGAEWRTQTTADDACFEVFPVFDPSGSLSDACLLKLSSAGVMLYHQDPSNAAVAFRWTQVVSVKGQETAGVDIMDELLMTVDRFPKSAFRFESEEPVVVVIGAYNEHCGNNRPP